MKKKKQIPGFALVPQTTKIMAIVHGKCLVKMEKALYLLDGRHEQQMSSDW